MNNYRVAALSSKAIFPIITCALLFSYIQKAALPKPYGLPYPKNILVFKNITVARAKTASNVTAFQITSLFIE
jgi:hypothetical protein